MRRALVGIVTAALVGFGGVALAAPASAGGPTTTIPPQKVCVKWTYKYQGSSLSRVCARYEYR